MQRVRTAALIIAAGALVACGGVSLNRRLRARLEEMARARRVRLVLAKPGLCADNAAMVAVSGYHHLKKGEAAGLCDDVYSRAY